MTEGLSPDLALAALAAFLGAAAIARRWLGWGTALAVAALKVLFLLAWFGLFDTGTVRSLDDLTYYGESSRLVASGAAPWELVTDPALARELFVVAGGQHVGYYVWNVLALWLFGDHYWSAVFLNVVCTVVAAGALVRLMELAGYGPRAVRAAAVFFLLHWDVFAWSSLLNYKDSLVLCLSAWMVLQGTRFALRPGWRPLLPLLGLSALLAFLRWYAPLLLLVALGVHAAFGARGRRRTALLAGALLLALVLRPIGVDASAVQPGGLLPGAVRFLTTPRPWAIEPGARFLLIPAVLHWLLLPVAAWGAVGVWRRHPAARLALLWFAVVVAFYAVVPALSGPRQRFQASFVLALLQFHGLLVVGRAVLARPVRAAAPGAGAGAPRATDLAGLPAPGGRP